ncbi:hypothetical protein CTAYLR_006187 [Chrysophaeum taylorii]|uniref:Protein phosphatase 1 regulatory subunit 11 n=1 Tax=Chrysophaeum taylorii TaxID=2483200 RepID=A0AAD7UP85_9STRA|nr:hypothetical protein CTAYLR_006187 [Chrysophaeum taylorii]
MESIETETAPSVAEPQRLVLRLRPRRHITFSADTVDNEHMKKRSSKRCCIYHKRREFGESSSESSSGSECECEEKEVAVAEPKTSAQDVPGAGWTRRGVIRPGAAAAASKPKVPDYQRFHA